MLSTHNHTFSLLEDIQTISNAVTMPHLNNHEGMQSFVDVSITDVQFSIATCALSEWNFMKDHESNEVMQVLKQ